MVHSLSTSWEEFNTASGKDSVGPASELRPNQRIQADGSACHAAGVTSESGELKTKRWPAARQADRA